jgi:TRAP-type C4-dicarboxylate transport system permease small subunit
MSTDANEAVAAAPSAERLAQELAQTFAEAEAPIDLSGYAFEDWLALALFWVMVAIVFLQFFTRYVMNDSYSWTEEIARYFLIALTYIGAAMCVRRNRHIQVDVLYRLLSPRVGRVLATVVDVLRCAFLGYATWLTYVMMTKVGHQQMTMIDLPLGIVYGFVLAGFALMFLRAAKVALDNWRQGYSILERPEAYEQEVL